MTKKTRSLYNRMQTGQKKKRDQNKKLETRRKTIEAKPKPES